MKDEKQQLLVEKEYASFPNLLEIYNKSLKDRLLSFNFYIVFIQNLIRSGITVKDIYQKILLFLQGEGIDPKDFMSYSNFARHVNLKLNVKENRYPDSSLLKKLVVEPGNDLENNVKNNDVVSEALSLADRYNVVKGL